MSKRSRNQGKRQQLHSIIDKLRGVQDKLEENHLDGKLQSEDNKDFKIERDTLDDQNTGSETNGSATLSPVSSAEDTQVDNGEIQSTEMEVNVSNDNTEPDQLSKPGRAVLKRDSTQNCLAFSSHSPAINRKRTYICDHCGAVLSRSDLLKRHMLIHTDLKPFQCNQCGRFFRNKSGLQVHVRTHTGERPYSCTVCGKGFRKSSDLTRHGVVHTGARPAICSYCGRGFRDSFQLNIHTRSHTGEKPYKCSICGKKFSRSDNMQEHERKHSGWKKYRCSICARGYALRKSYDNHMKIHESSDSGVA